MFHVSLLTEEYITALIASLVPQECMQALMVPISAADGAEVGVLGWPRCRQIGTMIRSSLKHCDYLFNLVH